jgi:hypothetical protein
LIEATEIRLRSGIEEHHRDTVGVKLRLFALLIVCVFLSAACGALRSALSSSDDVARAIRASDNSIDYLDDVVRAARNNVDDFDNLKPVSTFSDESLEAIIARNGGKTAQARPFYDSIDNAALALEQQGQTIDDSVKQVLTTSGCAVLDYYADRGEFPSIEAFALYLGEAVAEDVFELPDVDVAETVLDSLAPLQSGQTVATWLALTVAACDYI